MPHTSQTRHERKLATRSKLMGPISSQLPRNSPKLPKSSFVVWIKRLRFHISSAIQKRITGKNEKI